MRQDRAVTPIGFHAALQWLGQRDRGFAALRRAARTAIVMPAMFAIADKVLDDPQAATFAAFGSFAMLLLVDFGGPIRDRLQAQAALAVVGAVFVCVGSLAARNAWLAAAAMGVVGFGVLFAGVVSSVLAGASTSLLLAFILPVSLPGPAEEIPNRLAGWGLAAGASMLAISLLWPAPAIDPLRSRAVAACRGLSLRMRTDIAYALGGPDRPTTAAHDAAIAEADAAVAALRQGFIATPYRPTGLSTPARALVRLVDELSWLNAIVTQAGPTPGGAHVNRSACAVKVACAAVLERGAELLERSGSSTGSSSDGLHQALAELDEALLRMEQNATIELPVTQPEDGVGEFISALDPSFRAQEMSFVVTQIAGNIDLAIAAERRTWLDRWLGHQPPGLTGRFSAAQQRAAAHVERHSVWLHNSFRGAIGLALAVLVADLTGVQHSFWVVLGTLSVLRSNALNTGQNALRGLLGTVAGFVIGAAVLALIGTDTTLLWFLLPVAILLAGIVPAAISFAAGQAAFTLTIVILFNIIEPAGWRVGLLRVEDVAIGCAVSLAVGVLFWPRGAAAALGRALAEAYVDSARYLASAVSFGMIRCDAGASAAVGLPAPPVPEAAAAAAASRRLDDTFRGYLAERGTKSLPLAEVTGLVNGVVGLRLAGDAVLELWGRDDGRAGGDRALARQELLSSSALVVGWYQGLAESLLGRGAVPEPLAHDALADSRLVSAVRHDLRDGDGHASATAVRMIWTGDHIDAARRLQDSIAAPARSAVGHRALSRDRLNWLRLSRSG
jgi:hypothetical protein